MSTKPQIRFAFSKINYIIMLAGIGVLLLGYIVMTMETAEYGFGSMGLTVGPILLLVGFVIEFFAIFYKQKRD
ncbi:MAG: DUF3098 domain-containing protein [Cytophagales bacterium]|nr:MAG: DUF3098 domain-containing protein [Cytophagales bacterium]